MRYVKVFLLSFNHWSVDSAKAYPTFDLRNAKFVSAMGNVCGEIGRLPTAVVLSAELEICDDVPYAVRTFVDMWRGNYRSAQVSINTLRFHSTQNAEKAKEVS
jgi:hypothetical protein